MVIATASRGIDERTPKAREVELCRICAVDECMSPQGLLGGKADAFIMRSAFSIVFVACAWSCASVCAVDSFAVYTVSAGRVESPPLGMLAMPLTSLTASSFGSSNRRWIIRALLMKTS